MGKIKVAVVGAGGTMGVRTSNNLAKATDTIELYFVEQGEKVILTKSSFQGREKHHQRQRPIES